MDLIGSLHLMMQSLMLKMSQWWVAEWSPMVCATWLWCQPYASETFGPLRSVIFIVVSRLAVPTKEQRSSKKDKWRWNHGPRNLYGALWWHSDQGTVEGQQAPRVTVAPIGATVPANAVTASCGTSKRFLIFFPQCCSNICLVFVLNRELCVALCMI